MHPVIASNALRRWRACCLHLVVVIGLAATGCSTPAIKTDKATILYAEGCVFVVDGATVSLADDLMRDWDFGDKCEVEVITKQKP